MGRLLRFGALAVLASLLVLSVKPASAQMMHYDLNVTVILTSDELLTGGQVCVSGEVDDICQDIESGTESGQVYSFTGLGGGEHTVTVAGDPYLEAVDYATLEDVTTDISISLYMEELPNLPNTGAGSTAGTPLSNGLFLATGALALLGAAFVLRREMVSAGR